ncbi:ABC transporter substrate-binding protein [Acetobacterium sp.]|uniref:ABC transporter substrate-binding protein n=1 Tax=Acetobacterium sp. TaxID=1872094 RepID=UPI002F3F27E2
MLVTSKGVLNILRERGEVNEKKILWLLLAVCLVMTMATACSNAGASAPNENATTSFTDTTGRTVEVPTNITKIVPSGSLAQMALFALAPEKFVGITSAWTDLNKQYIDTKYYELPVLGQFYGMKNLNLEEIARVNPQIIIDIGDAKKTVVEDMDAIQTQVGIPAVHIEGTMDKMAEAYRTLGKLLNMEKDGETLAKYCEKTNSDTQAIMDKVGEAGKVKVVYCMGDNGLNVIAKGSIHAEVIDKVSNNMAVLDSVSSMGTGDTVSMEQLLLWDPDVIIFAPGSIYSTVVADPAWQQLTAIKNGKYYEVPNGPYNWMGFPPSVNRYMGEIWMTQLLYPDQAKYNVYDKAKEYYKLFYHSDLTQDQYNALVANSIAKTAK